MTISFIAIGSNLGNRNSYIQKALACLEESDSVVVEAVSSFIETKACGGPVQGKYLNGVLKISTSLVPQKLLEFLQSIEKKLNRIRDIKNGPRTIDLDILLYGNQIIDDSNLKVPHPRMREREFVMRPLLEIEPQIEVKLNSLGEKILSRK